MRQLIILLFAASSFGANANTGETRTQADTKKQKSNYSVRSKSNLVSQNSKESAFDSELLLRTKVSDNWTFVAGGQFSRKLVSQTGRFDELTIGMKSKFFNKKYSGKFLLRYYPEESRRLSSNSNGYIESELKRTYMFGQIGMRTKYKYLRYLVTSNQKQTLDRFRVEAWPGYHVGKSSFGLYNHVDLKFPGSRSLSVGPYYRYRGKIFRPLIQVSSKVLSSSFEGAAPAVEDNYKITAELDFAI